MSPSLRRFLPAITTPIVLSLVLSAFGSGMGCKETACIQWSEREGTCPDRTAVRTFFGTCNDIATINDDGAYSGNLCCYDVTKHDSQFDCPVDTSSFATVTTAAGFVASTGSVGGVCDKSGTCGDIGTGCLGCALTGPCFKDFDTCSQSMDCIALVDCLSACMPPSDKPDGGLSDGGLSDGGMSDGGKPDGGKPDGGPQACEDACMEKIPKGVALYNSMITCAVCQQCPIDCFGKRDEVCALPDVIGAGGAGGAGHAR